MSNTATIVVDVKTLGMKEAVKDSTTFKANLDAAQSTVNKTNKVFAKSSANPNYQPQSGQGETKTARSIGGGSGTGSASSDFAAQAQGLGGLVHLYATFAANLFAVSAAWTALSKAMDITNLVKGLDQIGAATGRNLGSLAKQMVSVADGAISMQQAMTSTAMASSGGMSNSQILRMTQVAKNASLALGRDLPDSMDRLTKGIVKTQPELLDELGIMTRVIPAQQKYAESIGKTVGSLTQFEKIQAFTNAVLGEGEAKFSAINMDANPYTKLLSSIQNLMQSGLELVNKVLGPMITMLASSPTGLATVLAGIGAMLLKQAIPALGMFRENAKRAAADTLNIAKQKAVDAENAAIDREERAMALAKNKFLETDKGAALSKAVNNVSFNSRFAGKDLTSIMKKDASKLEYADINKLKEHHDNLLKMDQDSLTKREALLRDSLGRKLAAIKKFDAEVETEQMRSVNTTDKLPVTSQENLNKRILEKHQNRANSAEVVSNAINTTSTEGLRSGFGSMMENIREKDMKGWNKWSTVVKGGIGIVTQKLSSIVSAFGVWGQVAALVGIAFGVLDSWMTKSAKETAAYSTAVDALTSSFGNVDKTLEVISKKDPLGQMSIESVQAKANAMNDLTDNLTNLVHGYDKLQKAVGFWDKAKDWVWDMFGQGNADTLAAGLSNTVVDALKLMEEGKVKEDAKVSLSKILNNATDVTTFDNLNGYIKDMDPKKIATMARESNVFLKGINRNANNAASALTSFSNAIADVNKQSTVMSNKLLPTDDFSKMGLELAKVAKSMEEAIKNGPIDSLRALSKAASDPQLLSQLGQGLNVELGANKKQIDAMLVEIQQLEVASAEANAAYTKSITPDPNNRFSEKSALDKLLPKSKEQDYLEKSAAMASAALTAGIAKAEGMKNTFISIQQEFAEASFKNLAKGFKVALMEASIISAKGYLDVMKSGGVATAAADSALTQKGLDAQKEAVLAQFAVITSQENLKTATDALRLVIERERLTVALKELSASSDSKEGRNKVLADLAKNQEEIDTLKTRNSIINGDRSKLSKDVLSGKISPETKKALQDMPEYLAQMMNMSGQIAKIDAAKGAEAIKGKYATGVEKIDEAKRLQATKLKDLATEKEILLLREKNSSIYSEELATSITNNEKDTIRLNLASELLELNKKQIAIDLTKPLDTIPANESTKDRSARLSKSNAFSTAQSALDNERTSAIDATNTKLSASDQDLIDKRLKGINAIDQIRKDMAAREISDNDKLATTKLDMQLAEIKNMQDIGNISELNAATQIAAIERRKQEVAYTTQLYTARRAASKEIDTIQEQIDKVNKQPDSKDKTAELNLLNSQLLASQGALQTGIATINAADAAVRSSISNTMKAVTDKSDWTQGAKMGLQEYLNKVGDVASQSRDLMTKSFEGMTDALQEFVTTGKLDFNSLANSIIADMVRMAIQQSITRPLANIGMGLISSMFATGAGASASGGVPGVDFIGSGLVPKNAKGAAYDSGYQTFAKGGTFTNSIVSSPTLFKFAQGTGLMGEAGPEAIMPLKRDSQGNLGVRSGGAQQGGNNVVINIVESKEKAGTQERKNENGVDMISIFVEKVRSAIAGDIVRGSGAVPAAMSSTYGLNRVAGAY